MLPCPKEYRWHDLNTDELAKHIQQHENITLRLRKITIQSDISTFVNVSRTKLPRQNALYSKLFNRTDTLPILHKQISHRPD
jgi:hypothetical protein